MQTATISEIDSSNTTGSDSQSNTTAGGSCSLSLGTGTENEAAQILTGYFGWSRTGEVINGTLANQGSIDLATAAPSLAGYYSGFTNGSPASSSICSGTQILGVSGAGQCVIGTADATAAHVLTGKTYWVSAGAATTGTMANRGTWNIATTSFPGAGYFSGVTGTPSLSGICSSTAFGGANGEATCLSGVPTLTVSGNLNWGTFNSASTKSITLSIGGSGSSHAVMSFSGSGLSGFKITGIAGRSVVSTPSTSSNVIVAVTNPGQTSTTVDFQPIFLDGTEKTMTVTITDLMGSTSAITANATYDTPVLGISGLLTWYKADALTLSNGDALASWTDSSSNANHAVQGTAGYRPVYQASVVNSMPAVYFDGGSSADDYLPLTTRLTNVRTAILVVKHATGTQDYGFILGDSSATNFHGGTGTTFMAPSGFSATSSFFNGTSTAIGSITKGTAFQIVSIITDTNTTVGQISNDRGTSYNRSWNGWIAEVILYSEAITTGGSTGSDSSLNAIECYLGGKYNITLGHGC